MELTRKELLVLVIGGAAAACGGSSYGGGSQSSGQASGNCGANGTSATIAANHGHVLNVTKEDVIAGAAKTYDITGTANHSHSVTLTAADMAALQKNLEADEVSTVNLGHDHAIKVVCV